MRCPEYAPSDESLRVAKQTLGTFALIMLAWTAIWLLKSYLDTVLPWLGQSGATAAYWLLAKCAAWIAPSLILLRLSNRTVASQVNATEWRRWLSWGALIGLLIAATGFAGKALSGAPLISAKLDYATLNVLLIAPLFEEFLLRAAVLANLVPAFGFVRANLVTAFCFVVLHIPGWYMMGVLGDNLTQPLGGALSIFLLGLAFGWATKKGRSFLGGSVAHFLNNLAS